MMRKTTKFFNRVAAMLLTTLIVVSCSEAPVGEQRIIPIPAQMELTGGSLEIALAEIDNPQSKLIETTIDSGLDIPQEGYELAVTKSGITIKASSQSGAFYAKQTLKQLHNNGTIPCTQISDEPRLGYRGIMLDVSRHFFDNKEVFKLIDVMSYYKLNNLHMHLTDAGGWRLEMDSYPRLTEQTAFRTESDWRLWWDGKDRKYLPEGTEGAYGGYYTKEDMKSIIDYAASKHITIIPEIEFPGHSDEVFFAYPELSCSGKPYVNGDFCIGNPSSYEFMEKVLDEVMELFPSKYIHIGGDEAGKGAWKKCPKCQALMKKEGFDHVDELQSHFIRHADNYLTSKGRKLIGWDEILEGGLAKGATVMSWRGENGGIAAARMGQDVIMTPGGYMYLDFYQADPRTQPYAIGGHTPIKKVYSYNPIPVDSLTAGEQKHIVGVQANVWTEYMMDEDHLEYMIFPRALAVAEVGWSPQEIRSWDDFKKRVNANLPVLAAMDINAFKLSNEIEVTGGIDYNKKEISTMLDAEKYPVEIRYTTDGTTPTATSTLYESAIITKDSADIVAGIFIDGKLQGEPTRKRVDYHRAVGKKIDFASKMYKGYMAGGNEAIIDGIRGGLTYLDGRWQGYLDDMDAVVDMGEVTTINHVSIKFMQLIGPQVFLPKEVSVEVSEDGKNYTSLGTVVTTTPLDDPELSFMTYSFDKEVQARYVRILAPRANSGFTFTDEVVIW